MTEHGTPEEKYTTGQQINSAEATGEEELTGTTTDVTYALDEAITEWVTIQVEDQTYELAEMGAPADETATPEVTELGTMEYRDRVTDEPLTSHNETEEDGITGTTADGTTIQEGATLAQVTNQADQSYGLEETVTSADDTATSTMTDAGTMEEEYTGTVQELLRSTSTDEEGMTIPVNDHTD